jgi:DNA-binding CsgD family transcriptional regulator
MLMQALASREHLVDLIYDCALDPGLWPQALSRFAQAMGGVGCSLLWQHQISGEGEGVAAGIDPKALELFFAHYAAVNPIRKTPSDIAERIRNFVPDVIFDEDNIAKEDLIRTEFYNDFMRVFDFHSTVSVGLAAEGLMAATVDVLRPERRGAFTAGEAALARDLQPHFVRAFRLGRKLADLHSLNGALSEVIDHSPYGMFVLAGDGRVRHLNGVGRRLCSEHGGLAIRAGRLAAPTPDASARLDAMVAGACGQTGSRAGGSMALYCANRALPLSVLVAPSRNPCLEVFGGRPMAIVCVTDLEAGLSLPEQRLRDLFGLTRAEGRVALALFEGMDSRQASDSLNLSFNTVRGHLSRIFEKTDTRSQVELARLMMRSISISLE